MLCKKNKNLQKGGRFKPTFPIEIERQLVELLESKFFGLTRWKVLELTYSLAVTFF